VELALRIAGAALVAYLAGSIPWAVIVVRVFWHQDIRTLGSGNTGATNVLRVFGTVPGIGVLLLDGAKGAAGVWLASLLAPPGATEAIISRFAVLGAMAAISGHSFSPFIGFTGGKGVATAAGTVLILAPKAWPILIGVFLVAVALSRMVSVGSITLGVVFPGVCWGVYPERTALLAFTVLASALVLWRHRSNMWRIANGTEPKVTFKRRLWDDMRSRGRGNGGE